MAGANHTVTSDSLYATKNEQENTQNSVIKGDIRRDMTVDTDQKHQESFEAAANMLCQMKQRYELNKGHGKMDISDMGDFCMYLATL